MNNDILDKKNKLISDLCAITTTIDDVLYGTIQFTKFANEIIDTKEFQRLRDMKQLGLANYVFPNAIHTRFEHSLGTYYQSKELTKRLADVTYSSDMNEYLRAIPELTDYIEKNYKDKKCDFDKYLQELVNIAALCHDLGHGPFSHLFDDMFIHQSDLKHHPNALHERRSQLLIEKIIKESSYLSSRISNDHIQLIKNIIDPPENCNGFIYQIVSNHLNSLDVDKFDYITRDMTVIGKKSSFDYKPLITQAIVLNNRIAYPRDSAFVIYQLFNMRHTMHRQIYNNRGVINVNLMISDMMSHINQIMKVTESIKNMDVFCSFTDTFILQYPKYLEMTWIHDDNNPLQIHVDKIIEIYNRFKSHRLYNLIFAFVLEEPIKFDKKDIFKDNYSQYLDDIEMFTSVVGFVSGNKPNPLDNIYLYDYDDVKYSNDKIHHTGNIIPKPKHGISNLISHKYQEYVYMVFYKKTDDQSKKNIVPKLEEHFRNYISNQLQQYVINYIKI